MEKREVLSRIRERYPASLYLTFVGGRSLYIRYDAALGEERIGRLRAAITQLSLDERAREEEADLLISLGTEPCPGEKEKLLCLRCRDERYYFPDPNSEEAVMWTVYSLVKDLTWRQGKSPAKLRCITYSADQQALAARVLNTAEYWQHTLGAEVLPPLLEKAVTGAVSALERHAPCFAGRPLTAAGRDLIQQSLRLLPPPARQQMSGRELARLLYGEQPFEQDLDAWCRLMAKRQDFAAALERAENQIASVMFHMPMMETVVRLRDAVQELGQRYAAQEERRALAAALEGPVSFKRLEQGEVERLFAEPERICAEMARKKIAAAMLEPLAARLKRRVDQATPRALAAMRDWNRSLRDFCRVDVDERLNVSWEQSELREDDLIINDNGWSDSMLRGLYTNSGVIGGFYVCAWFCNPGLITRTREQNEQMSEEMSPIPGMTEHLIAALLQQPILEGRDDG